MRTASARLPGGLANETRRCTCAQRSADDGIDGARRDPGVVSPDRLEQRCATQDETGPRSEPLQHIELLSREHDGLSTTHDRTPLVDDEY